MRSSRANDLMFTAAEDCWLPLRQMQYLLGIPVSAFPSLRVQGCDGEAAQVLHGPNSFVLRSAANMLSRDGRCKTFNATADGALTARRRECFTLVSSCAVFSCFATLLDAGYIRGEGAGAMLLKSLVDAENGRCQMAAEASPTPRM